MGPKRLLPARAAAPTKRKSSKHYPGKSRMDISLVGHHLQRYFSSHPLYPNKNKNKFTRKNKKRSFIHSTNIYKGSTWISFSSNHREYLNKKLAIPALILYFTLCLNISKTEEILEASESTKQVLGKNNKNESRLNE